MTPSGTFCDAAVAPIAFGIHEERQEAHARQDWKDSEYAVGWMLAFNKTRAEVRVIL